MGWWQWGGMGWIMGKQITHQQVINLLAEHFEWSIAYIRAARAGETNEMERLEAERSARLEQLRKEANAE
jgi:hypothetical protein